MDLWVENMCDIQTILFLLTVASNEISCFKGNLVTKCNDFVLWRRSVVEGEREAVLYSVYIVISTLFYNFAYGTKQGRNQLIFSGWGKSIVTCSCTIFWGGRDDKKLVTCCCT